MADTATSALTALAGADVSDTDTQPIADASAGETKKITPPEQLIALQLRGVPTVESGEPADGTIIAGTGVFWIDTAASPQAFKFKYRSTSSPEVITNYILGTNA